MQFTQLKLLLNADKINLMFFFLMQEKTSNSIDHHVETKTEAQVSLDTILVFLLKPEILVAATFPPVLHYSDL